MSYKEDLWKAYYLLKREIENGESRDIKRLEELKRSAEIKAERIIANWESLGVLAK